MMLRRVIQKHRSVLDGPQREDPRIGHRRVSPRAKPPIPLDQEVATMTHDDVTNEELAELIERTTEAAKAYIRGDVRTYFKLIKHTEDNTLMSPFGGEPTRGFRRSEERRVGKE